MSTDTVWDHGVVSDGVTSGPRYICRIGRPSRTHALRNITPTYSADPWSASSEGAHITSRALMRMSVCNLLLQLNTLIDNTDKLLLKH
jgi:hypothetical protein